MLRVTRLYGSPPHPRGRAGVDKLELRSQVVCFTVRRVLIPMYYDVGQSLVVHKREIGSFVTLSLSLSLSEFHSNRSLGFSDTSVHQKVGRSRYRGVEGGVQLYRGCKMER